MIWLHLYLIIGGVYLVALITWMSRHPFYKHLIREHILIAVFEAAIWPILFPVAAIVWLMRRGK